MTNVLLFGHLHSKARGPRSKPAHNELSHPGLDRTRWVRRSTRNPWCKYYRIFTLLSWQLIEDQQISFFLYVPSSSTCQWKWPSQLHVPVECWCWQESVVSSVSTRHVQPPRHLDLPCVNASTKHFVCSVHVYCKLYVGTRISQVAGVASADVPCIVISLGSGRVFGSAK